MKIDLTKFYSLGNTSKINDCCSSYINYISSGKD